MMTLAPIDLVEQVDTERQECRQHDSDEDEKVRHLPNRSKLSSPPYQMQQQPPPHSQVHSTAYCI